ncbi:hypothetical protein, partial [Bacteroides pyogenes]|uniref:hypothetical protein n=1 Tax=Bacteroides pyogenes TaxID=310300 RepID=UPI001BA9CA9B
FVKIETRLNFTDRPARLCLTLTESRQKFVYPIRIVVRGIRIGKTENHAHTQLLVDRIERLPVYGCVRKFVIVSSVFFITRDKKSMPTTAR